MEIIKRISRKYILPLVGRGIISLSRLLALPVVVLVWLYQKTFSPDHGTAKVFFPYGFCKFYPSCSEYSRRLLLTEGLIALPKIIGRVARCNMFSVGGVDMPIKKN